MYGGFWPIATTRNRENHTVGFLGVLRQGHSDNRRDLLLLALGGELGLFALVGDILAMRFRWFNTT